MTDKMITKRNHAMFTVIEGIDGAGKTTVIETLAQHIFKTQQKLIKTREPGGTRFNESVRDLVLTNRDEPMHSLAEALIMLGLRKHHLEQTILPALSAGIDVLCSRYNPSTLVLQGKLGKPCLSEFLENLSCLEEMDFLREQPDLIIFLDAGNEVSRQRINAREEKDVLDEKFSQAELDTAKAWRVIIDKIRYENERLEDLRQVVTINAEWSIELVKEMVIAQYDQAYAKHCRRRDNSLSFGEVMVLSA